MAEIRQIRTRFEPETPIGRIRPYENNPRIITKEAVEAVARSIKAYKFNEPIIVDEEGVILAGHNRLKASLELGLETVPVIWVGGLDDTGARAYRIADNKTGEYASWDNEKLERELRELLDAGEDTAPLALEQWELDRLLAHDEPKEVEKEHVLDFLKSKVEFDKERRARRKEEAQEDDDEVETAEKRVKKDKPSFQSQRVVILMETDEDFEAMRKVFQIGEGGKIPNVIRFSEVAV